MTSVEHDDNIEVISYESEREPRNGGGVDRNNFSSSRAHLRGCSTSGQERDPSYIKPLVNRDVQGVTFNGVVRETSISVTARKESVAETSWPLPPKYRRTKCIIIVVAALMLLACILIVGISLSMSQHINGLGTTVYLALFCNKLFTNNNG